MGAHREVSIGERIAVAQIIFGEMDVGLRMRQMLRSLRWRWAQSSRGAFLGTVRAYEKFV